MNGYTQPFASGAKGSPHHAQRHSVDVGAQNAMRGQGSGNGAMPMPVGAPQRSYPGMQQGDVAGFGPMGMPRSPPKNKNTQHVPCKFFLQGQCQAGRMCPFSHDIESTTRPAPCKYFAKGGCKFGRKCALLHITPDGTIVNRLPPPAFQPGPPFPGAQSQAQPGAYPQPPPGLLSMQAQGLEQRPNGEGMHEFENYQYGPRNGYEQPIDMTLTSASPPFYGSPPQHERLGVSPSQKGLSVLDAPLPNSFDSNGVSMAARNGPFAASVPSRFGIDSPPSSLPSKLGNTALRDLHSSAFGERGMDGVLASMGSSPPSGTDEPMTFPKRSLHSDRLRSSRQIVSASLGTRLPTTSFEYSEDEDFSDREEDLLPASLRDLIPESKSRRQSRSRADEETPAGFLSAARRTLSSHGTPQDSKVGSLGSSPSRYTNMFARAQAGKSEPDGFGPVGSPLRSSGFPWGGPPRSTNGNGELSPSVSSPPRQASMSMLTQELQRTKLDVARSQSQATTGATSHPGTARTVSNGSTGRSSLDRGMSSTSVGKIDEEQELFDMDEVGPAKALSRSAQIGESDFGAIGGHRSGK